MRRAYSFVLLVLFFLISCQPQSNQTITIIDGSQIHQLTATERVPASLLTQVGIHLAADDIVLLNGKPIVLNQPIPTSQNYTLQVQRAVALTVNGKIIQTTAETVGEALSQAGAQIYSSDQINPPIQTSITGPMTVNDVPSRALTVMVDGRTWPIRSSAATTGRRAGRGRDSTPWAGLQPTIRGSGASIERTNPSHTLQRIHCLIGKIHLVQNGLSTVGKCRTRSTTSLTSRPTRFISWPHSNFLSGWAGSFASKRS